VSPDAGVGIKGRQFIPLSLVASALLAACGPAQEGGDVARQSEADTPAASPGATRAEGSGADAPAPQAFATKVGESGLYQVAAAGIALQRTRSNEVRDYANMIVRDHARGLDRLKAGVASDGSTLVLPAGPDERQRAAIAALREAPNFDAVYLQQQRRSLEEGLGDLRRFALRGEGKALRAFAAETAAIVNGHRDALRKIEAAAGNDGRTDRPGAAVPD
jgi:putative membrane protein